MAHFIRWFGLLAAALLLPLSPARAAAPQRGGLRTEAAYELAPMALPSGIRVQRNIAYGRDPLQRFDVYLPAHPRHAPVIVMVHGGGWSRGDKAMRSVVEHKVARWVPRGFILVSVNYRLLPQASVQQQVEDIAQALMVAQRRAVDWGGDRERFILMGHSAGAHLVALLTAEPALALARGASPWLGTVSLDSAALDVPAIMRMPHLRLYDRAFGSDPAYWASVSPYQQLRAPTVPTLLVCSSRRRDSCPQARSFAGKAHTFESRSEPLPEDLSHREIDLQLGLDPDYTRAVEQFMASLDPAVARRLDDRVAQLSRLPVVIGR